jgi:ubiquinol-cytochrome c reductase cytochrome b/c1 subunit
MARMLPTRSFALAGFLGCSVAFAAFAAETPVSAPAPAVGAGRAPSAAQTPSAPPSEPLPPKRGAWTFSGPFGTFDRAQLQRGFQVYKEVCSNCHMLKHIAFRNLAEPGGPEFTPEQVAAIAGAYMVPAGPNEQGQTTDDKGQPLTRPATPADYYPPPFPNEQSARASNNGALPPDLSMIVRARAGGSDYVYSIVTGDGTPPPPGVKVKSGMFYDPYFAGRQIAMPPPLTDGAVTYADGTPNTLDQEARDVVSFLTWASEPKMEERKRMGFNVMAFLIVFTGLLYLSYRKVWHGAH